MRDRRTWLALGAAVALVQVFLMVGAWVQAPHNGGDNAGYVALAHSLLEGQGYVEAWDPASPLHTKYPPLYPAMLAVAIALGARTWTALKLVSAVAATLSVLLAFAWAARRRGPWAGAAVGLLLAAAPGLLWYSHWVLSDVPFLALTMLALVCLERADPAELPASVPDVPREADVPGEASHAPGTGSRPRSTAWLVAGLAAAILAYFTRSAGLPLLVAAAGWLALRARWRALAAFAVAAGVPAVSWWLRGRGGTDYVAEFWMVDPYTPALGTIGVPGLFGRAWDNAVLYATRHVPEGLVGPFGVLTLVAGLVLLALALLAWGMRMRRIRSHGAGRGVHVAELFLPLYAGLILLWPEVWSGDRFALPLFPLLLLYAGEGLATVADRLVAGFVAVGRQARAVAAVVALATLAIGVPATLAWAGAREGARACADVMRSVRSGPYDCHGPEWAEFLDAARWAGANLPEGSVVLTRKPRIFYVMGGPRSRTYPFSPDPETFLQAAVDAGARWVLLDAVGSQGVLYVGEVVRQLPGAFCAVASFQASSRGASQLLGILAPGQAAGGRIEEGEEGERSVRIPPCPAPLRPEVETRPPPFDGLAIPLLTRPGR